MSFLQLLFEDVLLYEKKIMRKVFPLVSLFRFYMRWTHVELHYMCSY